MKVINSQIYKKKKAPIETIFHIIKELNQSGEIWLTLYDTQEKANPNYIQIHSETNKKDEKFCRNNDKQPFLSYVGMVEARIYNKEGDFRHYRIFSKDFDYICAAFSAYYNDQSFDYSSWEDVTHEFNS